MRIDIKYRRRSRFHAIQALYQNMILNIPITSLIKQFYSDNFSRHKVDWEFFSIIVEGVFKNLSVINKKISLYAHSDVNLISLIDLSILRLGSYELYDLKLPHKIIIDEYIKQSKVFSSEKSYCFINGILDKISHDFRS